MSRVSFGGGGSPIVQLWNAITGKSEPWQGTAGAAHVVLPHYAKAGNSYICSWGMDAANAGTVNHAILFNPAASGMEVHVDKIRVSFDQINTPSATVHNSIALGWENSSAAYVTGSGTGGHRRVINKLGSTAALDKATQGNTFEVGSLTNDVAWSGTHTRMFLFTNIADNYTFDFSDDPIVIPEGFGLAFEGGVAEKLPFNVFCREVKP